jgi:hypothetical protein
MRSVMLQMGISLDGYVARPDGSLDWGLPSEDEAVTAWKMDSVRTGGDIMAHGGATFVQALSRHPAPGPHREEATHGTRNL